MLFFSLNVGNNFLQQLWMNYLIFHLQYLQIQKMELENIKQQDIRPNENKGKQQKTKIKILIDLENIQPQQSYSSSFENFVLSGQDKQSFWDYWKNKIYQRIVQEMNKFLNKLYYKNWVYNFTNQLEHIFAMITLFNKSEEGNIMNIKQLYKISQFNECMQLIKLFQKDQVGEISFMVELKQLQKKKKKQKIPPHPTQLFRRLDKFLQNISEQLQTFFLFQTLTAATVVKIFNGQIILDQRQYAFQHPQQALMTIKKSLRQTQKSRIQFMKLNQEFLDSQSKIEKKYWNKTSKMCILAILAIQCCFVNIMQCLISKILIKKQEQGKRTIILKGNLLDTSQIQNIISQILNSDHHGMYALKIQVRKKLGSYYSNVNDTLLKEKLLNYLMDQTQMSSVSDFDLIVKINECNTIWNLSEKQYRVLAQYRDVRRQMIESFFFVNIQCMKNEIRLRDLSQTAVLKNNQLQVLFGQRIDKFIEIYEQLKIIGVKNKDYNEYIHLSFKRNDLIMSKIRQMSVETKLVKNEITAIKNEIEHHKKLTRQQKFAEQVSINIEKISLQFTTIKEMLKKFNIAQTEQMRQNIYGNIITQTALTYEWIIVGQLVLRNQIKQDNSQRNQSFNDDFKFVNLVSQVLNINFDGRSLINREIIEGQTKFKVININDKFMKSQRLNQYINPTLVDNLFKIKIGKQQRKLNLLLEQQIRMFDDYIDSNQRQALQQRNFIKLFFLFHLKNVYKQSPNIFRELTFNILKSNVQYFQQHHITMFYKQFQNALQEHIDNTFQNLVKQYYQKLKIWFELNKKTMSKIIGQHEINILSVLIKYPYTGQFKDSQNISQKIFRLYDTYDLNLSRFLLSAALSEAEQKAILLQICNYIRLYYHQFSDTRKQFDSTIQQMEQLKNKNIQKGRTVGLIVQFLKQQLELIDLKQVPKRQQWIKVCQKKQKQIIDKVNEEYNIQLNVIQKIVDLENDLLSKIIDQQQDKQLQQNQLQSFMFNNLFKLISQTSTRLKKPFSEIILQDDAIMNIQNSVISLKQNNNLKLEVMQNISEMNSEIIEMQQSRNENIKKQFNEIKSAQYRNNNVLESELKDFLIYEMNKISVEVIGQGVILADQTWPQLQDLLLRLYDQIRINKNDSVVLKQSLNQIATLLNLAKNSKNTLIQSEIKNLLAAKNVFQEKIKNLGIQINGLKQSILKNNSLIKNYENTIQMARIDLQNQKKNKGQQIALLTNKKLDIQRELGIIRGQLNDLQNTLEIKNVELRNNNLVVQQLNSIKAKYNQQQRKTDHLEKQLNQKRNIIVENHKRQLKIIEQKQRYINVLKNEVNQKNRQIDYLIQKQKQGNANSIQIKSLKIEVQKKNKQIFDLTTQMDLKQNNVENIRGSVFVLQQRERANQKRIEILQNQIRMNEDMLVEQQKRKQQKIDEIKILRDEHEKLKNRFSQNLKNKQQLTIQLNKAKKTISNLEQDRNKIQNQRKNNLQKLQQARTASLNQNKIVNELKIQYQQNMQIQTSKSVLDEKRKIIKQANQKKVRLQIQYENLKQSIDVLDNSIDIIKKELQNKEIQRNGLNEQFINVAEFNQKYLEYQNRINRLETEIASKQKQLTESKVKIQIIETKNKKYSEIKKMNINLIKQIQNGNYQIQQTLMNIFEIILRRREQFLTVHDRINDLQSDRNIVLSQIQREELKIQNIVQNYDKYLSFKARCMIVINQLIVNLLQQIQFMNRLTEQNDGLKLLQTRYSDQIKRNQIYIKQREQECRLLKEKYQRQIIERKKDSESKQMIIKEEVRQKNLLNNSLRSFDLRNRNIHIILTLSENNEILKSILIQFQKKNNQLEQQIKNTMDQEQRDMLIQIYQLSKKRLTDLMEIYNLHQKDNIILKQYNKQFISVLRDLKFRSDQINQQSLFDNLKHISTIKLLLKEKISEIKKNQYLQTKRSTNILKQQNHYKSVENSTNPIAIQNNTFQIRQKQSFEFNKMLNVIIFIIQSIIEMIQICQQGLLSAERVLNKSKNMYINQQTKTMIKKLVNVYQLFIKTYQSLLFFIQSQFPRDKAPELFNIITNLIAEKKK